MDMFGSQFYQPDRVLVLVREELTEEFIRPPISSLLLQNVFMVTTINIFSIGIRIL
jgi:hypothetical protein